MTVGEALAEARARGVDRLDARLLLGRVLGRPGTWLIAHAGDAVPDDALARFREAVQRRADAVPLAYLLGSKEFHGLTLDVTPDVLVPRADTETLVDWALELLAVSLAEVPAPRVVDLGTGSGAIALAVRHAAPHAEVIAVDASPAALAVAAANAQRLGLDVTWRHGDWWSALGTARFDLALSNPPYVAEGDPHLAALRHEPVAALTSGADGLDAIRAIVAGAAAHVVPGGWLLLEHGHDQADAVAALLRGSGWREVSSRADLAGIRRCTGGRRP